ncbi:MAG: UPF0158 family protein [Pseudomonas sp.]|uniref:UPF0158 family protein n=1 Tax=Pseudomonas sp. TaxID=306 RepID=UPI002733A6A2|nr:UPF0158 family protein [Pseudomonas sp.]MDP3845751.1 UPF0158 family protein [Pseudomonas sp.]
MRPLTIDLDELAFALNSHNTEHYLDLQTGQVLMFAEEGIDPELDELLQDDPDRLLLIDPLGSSEGFALMAQFLQDVTQPAAYQVLEQALAGRKPFRTFKHALGAYPDLLQAWYDFENTRQREQALTWLIENDIQQI